MSWNERMDQRFDPDVPVAYRKQQVDGSVRIWTGIGDETITGPFQIGDTVKANSAYIRLHVQVFLNGTSPNLSVYKAMFISMQGRFPSDVKSVLVIV